MDKWKISFTFVYVCEMPDII